MVLSSALWKIPGAHNSVLKVTIQETVFVGTACKHVLNLKHTLDFRWHQGDLSRWLKWSTCLHSVLSWDGLKNILKCFPGLRSKSSLQFSKPSGMSSFSIISYTRPWHALTATPIVFPGFAWGRSWPLGPTDFNRAISGMILAHCGILQCSSHLIPVSRTSEIQR